MHFIKASTKLAWIMHTYKAKLLMVILVVHYFGIVSIEFKGE
ncbi:hypothetical protein SALWKB12_0929 [Snodgrassella communis]|nr:hypothetical protein SALWKB12_0929 [Snodgrassella communis]